MMKIQNNWINKIISVLLISALTISVAIASSLTQPKIDGLIGEQADGYIGLVKADVPASIRKLVAEVNADRRAGYQRIAAQRGISLSEVEKVGGNTAYQKTVKGNYYRDVNDVWHTK